MLRGWLTRVPVFLKRLRYALPRRNVTQITVTAPAPARPRLEHVVLSDGVLQTLFADYEQHRRTVRGAEEIGWLLLGHWDEGQAIALAALPAGAEREASEGHVRFNTDAQALASFILRQKDKHLREIGVVHTHPGSMRYPSSRDLLGDSRWVSQLRSGEAIFGIGTANGAGEDADDLNVTGDVCFSWYALAASESQYRPLPVEMQGGADLAMGLRLVWSVIEAHAAPLLRLCRQLARVQIEFAREEGQTLLAVKIALPRPNQQLRLLLATGQVRYYWECDGKLTAIEPHEPNLERAVYLILAELAKELPEAQDSRMLVEA